MLDLFADCQRRFFTSRDQLIEPERLHEVGGRNVIFSDGTDPNLDPVHVSLADEMGRSNTYKYSAMQR